MTAVTDYGTSLVNVNPVPCNDPREGEAMRTVDNSAHQIAGPVITRCCPKCSNGRFRLGVSSGGLICSGGISLSAGFSCSGLTTTVAGGLISGGVIAILLGCGIGCVSAMDRDETGC